MAGDTPHDASAPSPASNTPDKPTHATGPESHILGGQAAKHGGFWA
jgi:KUP system potassium uptake protein